MSYLPYIPPVKFSDWYGTPKIIDPENREVLEISYTSRDLVYEAKMKEKVALIVDLLNGKKFIRYNKETNEYDVFEYDPDNLYGEFATKSVSSVPDVTVPVDKGSNGDTVTIETKVDDHGKIEIVAKKRRGNPAFFKGMKALNPFGRGGKYKK